MSTLTTFFFTLATFVQHSFWSSSHGNQRRKEIKGIQTEKEEVKIRTSGNDWYGYYDIPENSDARKVVSLAGNDNIVLEAGTYTFYFKPNYGYGDRIWIAKE